MQPQSTRVEGADIVMQSLSLSTSGELMRGQGGMEKAASQDSDRVTLRHGGGRIR